ncbi:MAG: hypothetical protein LBC97_08435 [Bifidobacteriaceae bacterium]|jgi:hypothetical protein|nr:hypothetical protein [Bifidobacteriaceae bacterium]
MMNAERTALRQEIRGRQARWLRFLERLDARAAEFAAAASAELARTRQSDPDPDKAALTRLLSAVCTQLKGLRDKADKVFDDQILDFSYELREAVDVHDPLRREVDEFMSACRAAHNRFNENARRLEGDLRREAEGDLELEYQAALASFDQAKDQFFCQTCGARLEIERLFFIETHVACGYCGALHNFQPGAQARWVQHMAHDLAARRCAGQLAKYEAEKDRERLLYSQAHELKLSSVGRSEREKAAIGQEIARLDRLRIEAAQNAPRLYLGYRRAVYDQLNLILPEFRDHHERCFREESRSAAEGPELTEGIAK